MLFVERNSLIAIAGLGDHFHIRLLVDHGGQSVPDYRMVIRQDDADLPFDDGDHHGLRFVMRTLMRVPAPGWLSIFHAPPMAPARWRMLLRPNPSLASSSGCCSMPTPSSATASSQSLSPSVIMMCTLRGRAWRTALLTASCEIRSSSCSCSGFKPVAKPPPSKVLVT